MIHTAEGEDACANSVRFNDLVVVPAGFAKTAERLASSGYNARPVANTEATKLDWGNVLPVTEVFPCARIADKVNADSMSCRRELAVERKRQRIPFSPSRRVPADHLLSGGGAISRATR